MLIEDLAAQQKSEMIDHSDGGKLRLVNVYLYMLHKSIIKLKQEFLNQKLSTCAVTLF